MNSTFQFQKAVPADYTALTTLLSNNKLPVKDINKELPHFILAKKEDQLVGSIGIEKYGTIGLLRSLSTDALFQQQGIASQLLEELLALCQSEGIQSVYLLTETAKSFFEKRGFAITERSAAPDPIKNSSEFSELCPSTAVLMKKEV
jgi:amino-acid N-acetyltransferase